MGIFDFFTPKDKKESLDKGLEKTKDSFFGNLGRAVLGKSTIDEEVLDNLEEILVMADVGIETTLKIIERVEKRVEKDKYINAQELDSILKDEIASLLSENNTESLSDFTLPADKKPYVMMVVGVNGVGKTTTIGKLAAQYHKRGYKVVLGAGDTFRAAAVDQLKLWGDRVGVPVISHGMNTDPSSVAFDAVKHAVEMKADIVIIDTAGRLHTKVNLMNELGKIKKVIQKFIPDAPNEVLLVLDGSTGQNAVIQAREFTRVTEVTSLAITKLDGTAKGGVVIGISDEFKIPVKFIGVGEKIDDLQTFDKAAFVEAFFGRKIK
ncbi:MAG: signal recognition particle-docking protein FtsY [Opitutaceae bacterium]|nr:signal recognition particle-docking protein FtsY [Cytophagales bacterium]